MSWVVGFVFWGAVVAVYVRHQIRAGQRREQRLRESGWTRMR